ncbi:MAG TPA: response regulator [Gemmatimonadales bacterium]|nr:response regulator [Gemmatimonadales bacterium]
MNLDVETRSVILTAVTPEHRLDSTFGPYSMVEVGTGEQAVRWAHQVRPDAIILDADLPDMSATDACRLLCDDPTLERVVPILILSDALPSPEQRVAALRAGAWDFLRPQEAHGELALRLETYVRAKRNLEMSGDVVDPVSGMHSRHTLAQRARELGALMVRKNGALACVVMALSEGGDVRDMARLLRRTARVSDVLGSMGPDTLGVVAPATDDAGAIQFVRRVVVALARDGAQAGAPPPPVQRVGYDAVANLRYTPADPVALLARASAAVRGGRPDPSFPWVRRFDAGEEGRPAALGSSRISPPGLTLGIGRPRL